MAPRRTPAEVIRKLNADCVALIKAEVGTQLTADGITPVGSTPEALAAYIRSESTKWAQVVKASGAKAD
jgi:tripartite-type tricarboxylate transporter receptor subunit TctC